MKLKKIIIKKYDKDLGIFKKPYCFIHNFYSFYSFKFIDLVTISKFGKFYRSSFEEFRIHKNISPLSISLNDIGILTYRIDWGSIRTYTYIPSLVTSILVHSFLFYTYFYKTSFFMSHAFRNEIFKLRTVVGKTQKLYSCYKNFYFPFIYFLTFKSLKV